MHIYIQGLIFGLSLIISLGPQNLFLMRQGAQRNYALLSASVCMICDIILITGSIIGLHQLLEQHLLFKQLMCLLGGLFLLYYGSQSLRSAFSSKKNGDHEHHLLDNPWQVILLAMGFSLLNPQAIIDSLVIIGGGSSQFPQHEKEFLAGVLTSSFIWFFSLSFLAYCFSTRLMKANIWKKIEFFSGGLMIYLGIKLMIN